MKTTRTVKESDNNYSFNQSYNHYHLIRTTILIVLAVFLYLIIILLNTDFIFKTLFTLLFLFFLLSNYFSFPSRIVLTNDYLIIDKFSSIRLDRTNIYSIKQPGAELIRELKRAPQIGLTNLFGWAGTYEAYGRTYFVYSSSTNPKDNLIVEYGLDLYLISMNDPASLKKIME